MPTALIIALLANAEPIILAIEDIIGQIKAKGGGAAEMDAIAKDIVEVITDAVKAFDATAGK